MVNATHVYIQTGNGITANATHLAVNAGNGLVNDANGLSLGAPSAITATSTNSTTATSHTHAISEAAIRTLISDAPGHNLRGTYIMAATNFANNTDTAPGDLVAGSNLRPASSYGRTMNNTGLTGTWRCMGYTRNINGWSTAHDISREQETSLFLKVI